MTLCEWMKWGKLCECLWFGMRERERERERERDEISNKKKRMKKNYLNRIKCRIDREYERNS